MLLGYNSNGFAHHRLDEAIPLLAGSGFKVLALTPDICHLDPFRSTRKDWEAIRDLLDKHKMHCLIETGARFILDPKAKHRPNLLEDKGEDRQRRLDYLRRCLDIGHCLGAKVLSLWAGVLPQGVSKDQAKQHLSQALQELLNLARPLDISLALEPEPGMLISTVKDALGFLEQMGNPDGLGLCLDIGHLFVTGEAGPNGENLGKILKRTSSKLLQVHLEDIKIGIHSHLPPGEGDIDFDLVWEALQSIQYHGPVCFELSRSSHEAPIQIEKIPSLFPRVFRRS